MVHHKHVHHQHSNNQPSNFKNPKDYPTGPVRQTEKKSGFLGSLREKFREQPATKEEVEQLGLNAKRESFKTQIAKAKRERPGRFGGLLSSGPSSSGPSRSYGRQRQMPREENSFLFGNNQGGSGSFLSTPASNDNFLDMLGAGSPKKQKGQKGYVKSGFDEMLGI